MDSGRDRFQSSLREWLRRNDLDFGANFYSAEEWAARREGVLGNADFVVVTEGSLSVLLNHGFDQAKVDELQDLCSSFDYWFEIGHVWSIGFYRFDAKGTPVAYRTYGAKLRDPRWEYKAALVKERADYRCEDCGVKPPFLEAHHCWYQSGLDPWQYPLDAFRCLCRKCHEARAPLERRAWALLAGFSTTEMDEVRDGLERLFHWFDRRAVLNLFRALGPRESEMEDAVALLRRRMTEPGAG